MGMPESCPVVQEVSVIPLDISQAGLLRPRSCGVTTHTTGAVVAETCSDGSLLFVSRMVDSVIVPRISESSCECAEFKIGSLRLVLFASKVFCKTSVLAFLDANNLQMNVRLVNNMK